MSENETKPDRAVIAWLCAIYACILAMIVLGGVTRLTESGLSIVKWEPILGVLPPMNAAQWAERFDAFKSATGQAAAMFPNLTVEQFKPLFLWEYAHRLVGRMTGFVVGIPFVFFLVKRRLSKSLAIKVVAAFVFGGLQGGVGWLMVATGLQKDMTHVSHYALAAHLSLALALMSFVAWIIFDETRGQDARTTFPRWLRIAVRIFLTVLALQIVYGAFTAGLRAGHFYNTFPTMNGFWLPSEAFGASPFSDLASNPVTIQWTHRLLAWLLGIGSIAMWITGLKSDLNRAARFAMNMVFALTLLQFALGIATLLLNVPVWLGAWHQLNAALLLTASLRLIHASRS